MSRYDFDPYGHSQMYVSKWEREMHKAELRRAAEAARSRQQQSHRSGLSVNEAWIRVRVALAAVRRQLALG